MDPLIIVVIAIVVIGGAIFGYIQSEKRKNEMHEWAEANGLRFRRDKDHSVDSRYGRFSCLQKGSRRYAHNIIEGQWQERPIYAFDYHYETYSSNSKGQRTTHHHHFSAMILDTGLRLKPLFIRCEGFLDKLSDLVGVSDIEFELDEFNRRFFVKSPDRKWAFDVLHQATMEFMLRSPRFVLDFQDRYIMVYRNRRFAPGDFGAAVKTACGIVDRFPEYLLLELKGKG